ncbi:calcium/calmodulin-dependent protein kinase kinase-like [Paramacrobiotus metropolitanus]|uniref:calcium/calmodulin-dependent protein kinase kinase-like n=1 Tax=Paramacrobiotus metropolitanus TaxID=2943436 RepID=UPI002445B04F|nr:calcium/calmodulin-dependent protein kinase kinase-like [Paramacrobiotus metropolitanus]
MLRPTSWLSARESSSSPTPRAHVAKFLCPRYKVYEDAPSDTEIFTGPAGGDVAIESCGWEVQIFVDRKPEVICTDRLVVRDADVGTIQINDFLIEPDSDLGCGSFYTFRLASSTKDHGLYAIKSISKRKAQKNSMLFKQSKNPFLNIERETSILKKIYHPNIVKLFEIMDDPEEDNMYFVFEYMDRGCILTIPTDTPLKESVAISYMRDALYGVEYLHSKNIIHRDLKPENMLLNSFGRVKLIDFGLSFVHEEGNDITRLPYGTPSFTAPECLDGELPEGYSARAMEMWALGVTLFALLFGQVPFYHDNLFELYRMIQEDPVVTPTKTCCHISLNVRVLLRGMLEKNVKERLKLKDILSSTVFLWKNSSYYLPERCTTCQYYSPKSCHPVPV